MFRLRPDVRVLHESPETRHGQGVLGHHVVGHLDGPGEPVRDGLGRHTGQSLHLADDGLAVGQTGGVPQGGALLPRHPGDLLVAALLDLLVPHQVEHHPQQGRAGGLRPGLEQVQARHLQTLLVKVRVRPLLYLHEVNIDQISGLVGVQAAPVLRDGESEHLPELSDDPPPGVQPRDEVTEEAVPPEQILQDKPSLEQSETDLQSSLSSPLRETNLFSKFIILSTWGSPC